MARKIRVKFPGAIYHVPDRGDRREPISEDDDDRRSFLTTLAEACGRTGWRIHAYVLMGNHYHLLLETPEPNLVNGMVEAKGGKERGKLSRDPVVAHDHAEMEAKRLLSCGLKALGLREVERESLPRGDVRKAALAALIRSRTTVSNVWTAAALRMGHPSRVTNYLKIPKSQALRRKLEETLAIHASGCRSSLKRAR